MGALTTKTRGALRNCICWPFRMHAQVTGVSRSAPTSDLQAWRIARLCETRPSSSQKLRWLQVMDIETAIAASQSGVVAKGEEAPRSDCKESFEAVILMADRRRRPRTLALRQLQNPGHRWYCRVLQKTFDYPQPPAPTARPNHSIKNKMRLPKRVLYPSCCGSEMPGNGAGFSSTSWHAGPCAADLSRQSRVACW